MLQCHILAMSLWDGEPHRVHIPELYSPSALPRSPFPMHVPKGRGEGPTKPCTAVAHLQCNVLQSAASVA